VNDSAAVGAQQLRELIGADSLLTEAADIAPFLVDERRLYRGRAFAVALPRDAEQVARLVGWCNQHRIGVVPQGGNTGYCGGATPDESGRQLLLSLRRLNRIRAVDADNFSVTAEAGCVLASVQQAADAVERFFPLSLGSEGSCQIGGNLSTNAGGLNVVRYGMARDLVLGIEAVLPDGQRAARAEIAAQGQHRLRPEVAAGRRRGHARRDHRGNAQAVAENAQQRHRIRRAGDPEDALRLLGLLKAQAGERLSSFELLPRIAIELTTRHISGVTDPLGEVYPWYILCELTSAADEPLSELLQHTLAEAAERSLLLDAALATSERVRSAFWRLRETVPEAQRHAGSSLKHDISVPVAARCRSSSTRPRSGCAPTSATACWCATDTRAMATCISTSTASIGERSEAFLAQEPAFAARFTIWWRSLPAASAPSTASAA
jgi:FAD/FMN-containing dehydrogenase